MASSPVRLDITSAQHTYSAHIEAGITRRLAAALPALDDTKRVVVVTCPPVWRAHGARLRALAGRSSPVIIPDGERAKTLATVSRIYDALVKRGVDRGGTIVAFGGGVTGDVAGFAAATYLRGLRLVQVPTTLLAQVDSAIGGKVGVNLTAGKNLVGAFHPPALVACDPDVLGTLARREFRAGLYEVVKYGVIASRELFDRAASQMDAIFARDTDVLVPLIADCCRIKARVVMEDEREGGPRRVLNFGHTLGHALEAVTSYRRFRHGEAVAYGMLGAAAISAARGLLAADDLERLRDLITRLGPLPPVADLRASDVLDATTRDKKVVKGTLHFVLATSIGSTAIVGDVSTRELKDALRAIGVQR